MKQLLVSCANVTDLELICRMLYKDHPAISEIITPHGIAYCAAVAAPALEPANLPDFNENWLELSAKAGIGDFAFITRKG